MYLLCLAVFFLSCASSVQVLDQRAPPLWVTDLQRAYPDSEWLCVVESDTDARSAESAAIARLAQIFRVDLNSVTTANRQLAENVSNVRGQTVVMLSDSMDISNELVSVSTVEGLVGLQVESWTNPVDGRAYANARMNRRECSARYSAMIRENERTISALKEEAELYPATFEAFQMLNLAYSFALVTDNLHSLLTVLDTSAISRRPSYGNAEAVKTLVQSAGRLIVVTVNVAGDENGRITRAFTEVLNSRGFRTDTTGINLYTLAVSFSLEDVDIANSQNIFVRYILSYSLHNNDGVEILSFSENSREGHLSQAEARQRAIRSAERSIGGPGFAEIFDAFLASLL